MNGVDVFCNGPKDAPHPRRVIRTYMRLPNEPPEWQWLRWRPAKQSVISPPAWRPREAGKWPVHGDTIRLHCSDCRFDEKRSLDRNYGHDYPPFSELFEKLWNAGVREISVRALVERVVWKTDV